jgi:threonyl-tRNA synthetase
MDGDRGHLAEEQPICCHARRLESIAIDADAGRPPMLPLWLSPTQVRLIPVSAGHHELAERYRNELAGQQIRVDTDDRDSTIGRRVRAAEQEWVPFVVVLGDREQASGRLPVRIRQSRQQSEMALPELVQLVQPGTAGLPYRPLPLPPLVSQRPVFQG